MGDRPDDGRFVFRGDCLALDFVNTKVRGAGGNIEDLLAGASDLGDWLARTGILGAGWACGVMPALLDARSYPFEALAHMNAVLRAGSGYLQ